MGSNQPPIQEDDVFSSRDSTTASQRASSSRLHFSAYDSLQHRHRSPQKIRAGFSPPARRGSPLNPQNVIQTSELRRRPRPPDATYSSSESPPRSKKGNPMAKIHDSQSTEGPDTESEVGAFSNEYDLAHEDPKILQDVQRALKLKTRREARLKRETTVTPERTSTSHHAFLSSYSESSPKPFPTNFTTLSSVSASPNRKLSTSSEVDFSPSTGISDIPAEIHPAPTSLDNGNTLDWSCGSSHEGEKRWTKSIVKKKEKGILPPLGIMVDQQEQMHKEKLARISNLASAQTIQKAHMTQEQLDRRYNLIYESLRSKNSYNVAKVARWYSFQPDVTQRSLERLEPFTWLKHLQKRSGKSCRSPWNLTALIMEEFVQAHKWHMETIPEDSMLSSPILLYQRKSPPSFPSSPPKAVSDDRISFEPLSESNRNSWDATSYKSAESAGSVQSGSHHITPVSPVSSQMNDSRQESKLLSPFVEQTRPRKSKGLSSDESEEDIMAVPKSRDESINLTVPKVSIQPPPGETMLMDSTKAPAQPITLTTSTGSSSSGGTKQLASPAIRSLLSLGASLQPKQLTTAPVPNRLTRQGKKYRSEREKQLRREYEAKSLLLSEAARHNSKIRQLLNRLSTTMKDYDSLQNLTPENVRGMLPAVLKELVEAFGHDPAGVTGPTRRLQGWRAVEDIHHRVHRQQHTFKSFLDTFDEQPLSGQCALDQPIEILEMLLEELEKQKTEITANAESVSQLLTATQEVHGKLKEMYNKMVSHVSVVYPQLSHIVALEESYKDQYQQFWELGMDALTLLLDTVTPFWRTYGKTIGEDVRDFLIIPLYRNEFTGESKRYRIKEFPKRSWQHWLGLVVFFLTSIGVNILQIRAAISSTLHFRLSLIPYDGVRWTALPFFWISIIIQWFAVLLEFAIVFMELGVVVWWSGWTVNLIS